MHQISKLDSYRTRAVECLDQARRSDDEADKAIFLQMAEEWLSLAATGDKAPAPVYALVG